MKRWNRKCKNCNKTFVAKRKKIIYCSSCREKFSQRKCNKRRWVQKRQIELSMRKPSFCKRCNKNFENNHLRKIFCCENCRKTYWQNYQLKNNIIMRLNVMMSNRIYQCLKREKMERRWINLLGYNAHQLKIHLEKQFNSKMNWNNWGNYWEIDHKIPKSWFKYSQAEDNEFRKCWSLENLQPLELSTNRSKKNYYAS